MSGSRARRGRGSCEAISEIPLLSYSFGEGLQGAHCIYHQHLPSCALWLKSRTYHRSPRPAPRGGLPSSLRRCSCSPSLYPSCSADLSLAVTPSQHLSRTPARAGHPLFSRQQHLPTTIRHGALPFGKLLQLSHRTPVALRPWAPYCQVCKVRELPLGAVGSTTDELQHSPSDCRTCSARASSGHLHARQSALGASRTPVNSAKPTNLDLGWAARQRGGGDGRETSAAPCPPTSISSFPFLYRRQNVFHQYVLALDSGWHDSACRYERAGASRFPSRRRRRHGAVHAGQARPGAFRPTCLHSSCCELGAHGSLNCDLQEIFPKFEPSGTLIANWSTVGVSTTGQVIPVGDTAVKPQVSAGLHQCARFGSL